MGLAITRYMEYENELSIHNILPSRLLLPEATCPEAKISPIAPVAPTNTPKAFIRVIGSFRMIAANTITKIGEAVDMIDASIGEVFVSPYMNNPWFMAIPVIEQKNSKARSFFDTCSLGKKRDVSQNITQANSIRNKVKPKGVTCMGNNDLEMEIFIANRIFTIKINKWPMYLSFVIIDRQFIFTNVLFGLIL
jgi:hypothetical protein